MSVYSGDFLGFSIGGVHSSNLNITRISSGDRYTENLLPNFKDGILDVDGVDGIYYWNTKYSNRTFIIEFAYDYLGDNEIRDLRRLLGFKGVLPLVFDEFPYKKYMVKCQTPPNLKYICFKDLYNKGRVFKGEGTIQLIAYYPFGISTETFSYTNALLSSQKIVNSGDMPADFCIYYNISNYISNNKFNVILKNDTTNESLTISNLVNIGTVNVSSSWVADLYLMINTKTHLLEGLDSNYNKTGNLYNRFMTTGDFFKLQVGNNKITSKYNNTNILCEKLEYNRIYY